MLYSKFQSGYQPIPATTQWIQSNIVEIKTLLDYAKRAEYQVQMTNYKH